ncbi:MULTISPECIES: branched-chain amino acid ABC transporter permease [Alcanivoracaceae]|uniref:Branched-chain amino acid ABC transporter permease n=2 Tax=Alcanivoracaceae TaxID=224372 RepID=A0A9Q3W5M8_9GAMM|nr:MULTISPECIES: branched-chain amino acid ABC transporter permease [Alcanivoracaceae]KAF0806583.1 inner-membrane translocator [Alcanivorax xiamenensis]KYZ87753.1 inner-membrane translocator [Alcanivorax sp. KX64203]MCE7508272.1 branched-chain amino acid ABC transporter permease [Alloalcanivorax xenomutans]WOD27964.1 branched-chain amino acid ABC transporter permease [Alloalcanivorax xenomutans]
MKKVFDRRWFVSLLVLVLLAFPFLVGQSSYFMGLVVTMAIYAIAAMSLNLLTGYGGQVSIGQGGFLMMGTYSTGVLSTTFGLPIWLALPSAGVIAALVSLVIGLPAVRLKGHFLAVATLGFGLSIPEIALNWKSVTGGYSGLPLMRPEWASDDLTFFYVILMLTFLVTWVLMNIANSRLGRAFLAIRDSEIAAAATGINVAGYKTVMFMISAFFTGLAGGLYAYWIQYISPNDFTIMASFFLLAMIVVGGLASIWGAILGAVLFTGIPHFSDAYVGVTNLVIGLAVVLVILFRPAGLVSLGEFFQRRKQRPSGETPVEKVPGQDFEEADNA